ncbi:MAG: ABC transporter ATP-binding protein [Clostridiaceae bacterium]|nr:ABC transporter ATP-binding protein [Clostridiaceae bacterium]
MIEIKNLSFSYDEKVLNNININIEKGKFYTILGPNGSGKTTLLRLISKALNVNKKEIYIEKMDIYSMNFKQLAKKVAVVPQNTEVEFDFSVEDIVLMGRTPHISRFSSEGEKDFHLASVAMEITNTLKFKDKKINELSGGERQRVIVARAICQDTEIILLDEPISHLDIHHQIEIMNEIKSLNENKNITIVAVLHDLNLAAAYSDHMILMDKGRVHSYGRPEEILNEETIKEVYGLQVYITKNPKTNKTFIMPF